MTEVRIVESDLPPVMVGIAVHVTDGRTCMAAIVTELLYGGEAHVELFPRPGAPAPYRDQPYKFEPGGMSGGTFHRLLECPALSRSSLMGTWPPSPVAR